MENGAHRSSQQLEFVQMLLKTSQLKKHHTNDFRVYEAVKNVHF